MSAALAATAIVVLFAGATLLSDTLKGWRQTLPVLALSAALFLVFRELARYDHGYTEAFFWIGQVGAPLVAIFGGASWGTRRFYGWPDLGAHPSRAGFVAAAILAGVLVGVRTQQGDVERSMADAAPIARAVTAWEHEHGHLPGSLGLVLSPVPATHMGAVRPPPYRLGVDRGGAPLLAFPVGGTAWMTLDMRSDTWSRRSRPPRPVPAPDAS